MQPFSWPSLSPVKMAVLSAASKVLLTVVVGGLAILFVTGTAFIWKRRSFKQRTPPSPPLLQAPQPIQGSAKCHSFDLGDLLQGTRKIWERDLKQLPVAIDLPRLARNIVISDSRTGQQSETRITCVLDVLTKLSRILEQNEARAQLIESEFYDAVTHGDAGDSNSRGQREIIAPKLQIFLQDTVGERTKTIQVLKAVNQAIIAPAVTQFRMKLWDRLQFKDGGPGSWRVAICVSSDNICVSHIKGQKQFRTDGKEEEYQFKWQLDLYFSSDASSMLRASLKIVEVTAQNKAKIQEIKSLFEQFFSVECDTGAATA